NTMGKQHQGNCYSKEQHTLYWILRHDSTVRITLLVNINERTKYQISPKRLEASLSDMNQEIFTVRILILKQKET
ncbi:hypothetical protein ACJX0J_037424, partial [Zea mays]